MSFLNVTFIFVYLVFHNYIDTQKFFKYLNVKTIYYAGRESITLPTSTIGTSRHSLGSRANKERFNQYNTGSLVKQRVS